MAKDLSPDELSKELEARRLLKIRGRLIMAAMVMNSMSQSDLANVLHVSKSFVSKFLNVYDVVGIDVITDYMEQSELYFFNKGSRFMDTGDCKGVLMPIEHLISDK